MDWIGLTSGHEEHDCDEGHKLLFASAIDFDSFAWQRGLRFIWTEITTIWRNWFGKWQSLWGQFVKADSQQICPYLQQNCLSPTSILVPPCLTAENYNQLAAFSGIDSGTLEKIVVLWEPKVLTRPVWLKKKTDHGVCLCLRIFSNCHRKSLILEP